MKVNVNQTLKGVDGVEILKGQDGRPLILKDICITSLLTPNQQDDEKKKWDKYELYKKLQGAVKEGEELLVEIKAEEVVSLKAALGKTQTPLIMGQCWEMLEGVGNVKSITSKNIRK